MTRSFVTASLFIAASFGVVSAQAPTVVCRACANQGARDCTKHRRLLELERSVVHCSVAIACKTCRGALTRDCKICSNPTVEASARQRRDLAKAWLAERRTNVDEVSKGEGLLHAKSAHVQLVFSVRPLTVGKKKLDTHRLMHLYLARLEELRDKFIATFELAATDCAAPLEVYMFKDRLDHQRMAPRVAGAGRNSMSMKYMGDKSVYCMCHDRKTAPGDTELHRTVVHNVAHLLLSNMQPAVWLGNRKHGWIDAGVAHWFEDAVTGRCANYCYEEVGTQPGNYKGGRWRVPIRNALEAGKLESFTSIANLNTDQLTWPQHAQVFAYVDFLITRYGGAAFASMLRAVKQGEPTRDALQKAFKLGILQFDEEFKTWVRATYPRQ